MEEYMWMKDCWDSAVRWRVGYSVTRGLLCLERCTLVTFQSVSLLVSSVKTPLHFRAWQRALAQHPDGEFTGYVL